LYEFSLPHENKSEQELRLTLTDFLLKNYAEKSQTLVIIDEAKTSVPIFWKNSGYWAIWKREAASFANHRSPVYPH